MQVRFHSFTEPLTFSSLYGIFSPVRLRFIHTLFPVRAMLWGHGLFIVLIRYWALAMH